MPHSTWNFFRVRSGQGGEREVAVFERRAMGASEKTAKTSRDAGRSRKLFSATVDCDLESVSLSE